MTDFIDGQVRGNLMRLRVMRGFSQADLGLAAGLPASQVEAFETGAAVISCGALYVLAQALEVPIASLFEGLVLPSSPEGGGLDIDPIAMMELFKMLKAFNGLTASQQVMVRDYIQALLENSPGA